jgi:hypothetical protein
MEETAEQSDDRSDYEEPDEVHEASVSGPAVRETSARLELRLLLLELLVREDARLVEVLQLLQV